MKIFFGDFNTDNNSDLMVDNGDSWLLDVTVMSISAFSRKSNMAMSPWSLEVFMRKSTIHGGLSIAMLDDWRVTEKNGGI